LGIGYWGLDRIENNPIPNPQSPGHANLALTKPRATVTFRSPDLTSGKERTLISDKPRPIDDRRFKLILPFSAVDVMNQLKNERLFDEAVNIQIASLFELNRDCFVQSIPLPEGTTFVDVATRPPRVYCINKEQVTSISNDYRVEVRFPGELKHTLVSNIFQRNAKELAEICNRIGIGLDWVVTVHRSGEVVADARVAEQLAKLAFAFDKTQSFVLSYLFQISETSAVINLGKLSEPIKPYFPKPKPTDTFGPGTLPWRYGFASTVNAFRREYATKLLMSP
jgi:hypothetical protein